MRINLDLKSCSVKVSMLWFTNGYLKYTFKMMKEKENMYKINFQ